MAPEEKPDNASFWRWTTVAPLVVSVAALLLSISVQRQSAHDRNRTARLEATEKLRESFDLMGGETGTTYLTRVKDRRNLERIRRLLEDAQTLDPQDNRVFSSRVATMLGYYWSVIGRPNKANEQYRRAIQLNPDNSNAHGALGHSLREQGLIDEALTEYRKAIQLRPDSANAHQNLGVALERTGQRNQAIEEYRTAVQLDPDMAQAHYSLAFALTLEGKVREANEHLQRAGELDLDSAIARHNLVRMQAFVAAIEEALESEPADESEGVRQGDQTQPPC